MDPALSSEREPEGAALNPASIGNREALLGHGLTASRELALRVAEAGLVACDPGLAVERLVELDGDELIVDGVRHRLHPDGRIIVLGSGKASLKIALALERILGERLHGGTVVVRHGSAAAIPQRIELLEAAHPAARRAQRRRRPVAARAGRRGRRARSRDRLLHGRQLGAHEPAALPESAPRRSATSTGCCSARDCRSRRSTPSASRSPASRAAGWRSPSLRRA